MERDFWLERWESNQIGFHQDEFSPYLVKYWQSLNVPDKSPVFVPMAGKTKDMLWLANQGHQVLGIELSDIAVDAFFEENNLQATKQNTEKHIKYAVDNIDFLCGDFFHLTPDSTKNIKAVFDRASMVAMPPELRTKYATHMASLLSAGTKILLVSMEYPAGEMNGPPFSVSEKDVQDLFSDNFDISLLESIDVLANNDRLKSRGLTQMLEKVYVLTRK